MFNFPKPWKGDCHGVAAVAIAVHLRGQLRIMIALLVAFLGIFLVHWIEIWLWAVLYMFPGLFEDVQSAL